MRRGSPLGFHSRGSVSSSTAPEDHSTLEEGASTCRVLGRLFVAKGQHRLDHSRHPGGELSVADVGLERAQPQRLLPFLAVGGEQGAGLDRVAKRGAGAVGLDRVDVSGGEAGVGEGLADHSFLGGSVGGGEAVGGAVLIDRRAADRGQHPMAVCLGVGEALEDEHAGALAPADAVRPLGEGLAASVGGKHPLAGELDEGVGIGEEGDATRHRHSAFAGSESLRREMHGHQRGRAGGVDADRGALETQRVGDATRGDAGDRAGEPVALQLRHPAGPARARHGAGAGEDADLRTPQRGGIDAGRLQRLPGCFQEQPLLRVHRQRLARGDAEELGVEVAGAGEEPADARVGGAGGVGVGVVETLEVPAAVGGKGAGRVAALDQQAPELVGGVGAGEAAAHADDRDRLVVAKRGEGRGGRRDGARGDGEKVRREVGDARVVEDDRGGKAQPGPRHQPPAQLDGGRRVEAELLERAAGVDRRLLLTQHPRDLFADELRHPGISLVFGKRRDRRRPLATGAGSPLFGGLVLGERRRKVRASSRAQLKPVAAALERVGWQRDPPPGRL